MLYSKQRTPGWKKWRKVVPVPLMALLLTSCAQVDPRRVDIDLQPSLPEIKVTSFDQPLADLGKMSQIYGKRVIIQGQDIADHTGLSQYGFGEIPRDITEMTKSALNSIGGNVVYIPYVPVFINNQMVTGYSDFRDKYIPDIVLSGGITEFDRGLQTRGANTDFGVTTRPFNVNESWVPNDFISVDYGQGTKESLARITLDFNLVDFRTMSGVARMQTVNSIDVYKGLAAKELGFTIFGPSFGFKGTVTKVQGRHAAIRLLVQTSVLQIVGKYLYLPYWKLIPEMPPDPVVLERIAGTYRQLSDRDKIAEIQTCLYLKGYNVSVDGRLDTRTREALARFKPDAQAAGAPPDAALYIELWSSLADDMDQVAERRQLLARNLEAFEAGERIARTPARVPVRVNPDPAGGRKTAPKTEAATPAKMVPAPSPSAAATAVAQAQPDENVGDEAAPAAEQKEKDQENIARIMRRPYLPGNTYSVEALINERAVVE
ncbi:hypothetical protein [Desulfobulbus alkaliphilus]|uniref:hypothetical protein n=1 Tax=Desulfobulbus alkaliphilus TaxID=869814 RepID=UPI0019659DB3|nr:hypothetical protein [Desulfobulbus alkaliphilus]MBM9536611.1 hypothetical protein [Desulfobulbus alkaliphilus]